MTDVRLKLIPNCNRDDIIEGLAGFCAHVELNTAWAQKPANPFSNHLMSSLLIAIANKLFELEQLTPIKHPVQCATLIDTLRLTRVDIFANPSCQVKFESLQLIHPAVR